MITNRRLRHLIVLAEHRHFGRAARALHISQPALTKSIQALESELNIPLFNRTRGALELTAYGELVVQRGKSLLAVEESLRQDIENLANNSLGSLQAAIGPYLALMFVFPAAANLVAKYPSLKLKLQVSSWPDVLRQVGSGAMDFGVVEVSSALRRSDFVTEIIGEQDCHFFCRPGHPLLEHATPALEKLTRFPWVSSRIPESIASRLPHDLGNAGALDPSSGDMIPAIESNCPSLATKFLNSTDAIAVFTLSAMQTALECDQVCVLPVSTPILKTRYGFIFREGRPPSPSALAFMEETRACRPRAMQHEANLTARWIKGKQI